MKKSLLFLAAMLCAAFAVAAPSLYSDPYPAGPFQPTAAYVTVNGQQRIDCAMPKDANGSVTPTCDLAGLPVGTYSLVLTVSNTYGCTQDNNAATCYGGGVASSDPFSYTWSEAPATKPLRKFKP